jgi:hypothetical protein
VQHISNKMTIKEAKQQLREVACTIKKVDDEFSLRSPDIEYFTDSLEDAVDTARCEADQRNL